MSGSESIKHRNGSLDDTSQHSLQHSTSESVKNDESEAERIVHKSLSLASYGMFIQLSWRAMSFALNGILLRYVTAAMLGVANVRLALLHSTLMFLSREAFRRACLGHTQPENWRSFVNFLWLTFPIGILWCCVLVPVWLFALPRPAAQEVQNYDEAVLMYALAALLELLSEPLWVLSQLRLCVRLRMFVEASCAFVRSALLILMIVVRPQLGLWAFAWAQLIMAGFISVTFWLHCLLTVTTKPKDAPLLTLGDYLPSLRHPAMDTNMASLVLSFFKQSVLKQLLSEGERYIMSFFNLLNFSEQGVFDMVNNLGSLVARFIFQPLEDSAYLLFSQTLHRGRGIYQQNHSKLRSAHEYLSQTLRFASLVAFIIFIFGQTYSKTALHLYGGELLAGDSSSGPELMRTFAMYVVCIAWNGLTESFAFSLMSEKELNQHNYRFLLFSVVFVAVTLVLVSHLGAVGFILANCVNMLLRVRFNCTFIYFFFFPHDTSEKTREGKTTPQENPLWSLLPHKGVIAALLAALFITAGSHYWILELHKWNHMLCHIAIGGVSLCAVLGVLLITEKDCVHYFTTNVFRRKCVISVKNK